MRRGTMMRLSVACGMAQRVMTPYTHEFPVRSTRLSSYA